MPYVMMRDEPTLKLKAGQHLSFKEGELPSALAFSAKWSDGVEQEKQESFTQADLDAAFERGKASAEPQGEFIVNEEAVKKFLTNAIESRGENVRSDAKLSTLAKKYEELPTE